MFMCIGLYPDILTLFVYILYNRFEDDGEATTPFVVTNVPLQPLELPKAQPYMTVGKYHNAEPWSFIAIDDDSEHGC